MKKWLLSIILLSGLSLITVACSPDNNQVNTENLTPEPGPPPGPDDFQAANRRSLVVFFSSMNTTKGVAEQIAAEIILKIHRIVSEVAYTTADLDYNNSSSWASREQNDPSSRPAISNSIENQSDYDVVFLGYHLKHRLFELFL